MADEALQNAVKRRDELAAKINAAQQQIDEWKRDLARADSFISEWHAFAGTTPDIPIEPKVVVMAIRDDVPFPAKRKNLNNSKKEDVAAEVRRIIEERGEPVLRKDLMPVLSERGFKIEGTDPDMVLSTMLWRAGGAAGIVRLGRGGYWLKEKDWPDAYYLPELSDKIGPLQLNLERPENEDTADGSEPIEEDAEQQ